MVLALRTNTTPTINHWHQERWLGENPRMVLATIKRLKTRTKAAEDRRTAHFIVAIAYNKSVILAEQYEGNLNGQKFANFVREQFPTVFENSCNKKSKLFLQDGDPSQNSRKAKEAIAAVGARKFTIPARSPDLNPIENVFHNVKRQLQDDALSKQITKETYSQFCARIKATLLNYPPEIIDRTIASMDRRIDMVIRQRGQRIKY